MIRVLLVDDQPLARAGLRSLISQCEDIVVVSEAVGGEAALELARRQAPDVVLMDIAEATASIRAIQQASPGARVVVLSASWAPEHVLDAVDAGAAGYLLKTAEPDELLRGIRSAARGESPLAPKAAVALIADRARRITIQLTARERQVLSLVGRGFTNRQIATLLRIKETTVKAHLGQAYQRIGVRDRTQAALWVHRNGVWLTAIESAGHL